MPLHPQSLSKTVLLFSRSFSPSMPKKGKKKNWHPANLFFREEKQRPRQKASSWPCGKPTNTHTEIEQTERVKFYWEQEIDMLQAQPAKGMEMVASGTHILQIKLDAVASPESISVNFSFSSSYHTRFLMFLHHNHRSCDEHDWLMLLVLLLLLLLSSLWLLLLVLLGLLPMLNLSKQELHKETTTAAAVWIYSCLSNRCA
jgi:hypothetical protein